MVGLLFGLFLLLADFYRNVGYGVPLLVGGGLIAMGWAIRKSAQRRRLAADRLRAASRSNEHLPGSLSVVERRWQSLDATQGLVRSPERGDLVVQSRGCALSVVDEEQVLVVGLADKECHDPRSADYRSPMLRQVVLREPSHFVVGASAYFDKWVGGATARARLGGICVTLGAIATLLTTTAIFFDWQFRHASWRWCG
jgi:hypothetical protein